MGYLEEFHKLAGEVERPALTEAEPRGREDIPSREREDVPSPTIDAEKYAPGLKKLLGLVEPMAKEMFKQSREVENWWMKFRPEVESVKYSIPTAWMGELRPSIDEVLQLELETFSKLNSFAGSLATLRDRIKRLTTKK